MAFDANQIVGNPLFGMGIGLLGNDNPYQGIMQGLQATSGSRRALEQQAALEQQRVMQEKIAQLMQQGQLPGSALPPAAGAPPPEAAGAVPAAGSTPAMASGGMPQGVPVGPGMPPGAGPPPPGAMPQQQQQTSPGKLKEALGLHLLSSGDSSMAEHGIKLLTDAIDERKEEQQQNMFRDAVAGSENLTQQQKFRLSTLPYDDAVAAYKKFADPESEELVEVIGKDGVTRYMRRSQAAGQRPPEDDEPLEQVFNPDTQQTTYQRRSDAEGGIAPPRHGITIGPDGTVQIGGSTGGLQKKTQGALEQGIINAQEGMSRLQLVEDAFNSDFLTYQGAVKAETLTQYEKFGGTLSEERRQYLEDFTTLRQNTGENLARYVKEISGAAASDSEREQLAKNLPSPSDSPTQFRTKTQNKLKELKAVNARLNYFRTQGITPDANFNGIRLSQMPQIIQERGEEMEKELLAAGVPPDQIELAVRESLKVEFGL